MLGQQCAIRRWIETIASQQFDWKHAEGNNIANCWFVQDNIYYLPVYEHDSSFQSGIITGNSKSGNEYVRAEGVFALSKELHGLRRTRFKGRLKVQIQIWLTAAAINKSLGED